MPPYEIGQEIRIRPVVEQGPSLRESELSPYVGLTGKISNYHWITPPAGEIFYLYTVRVDGSNKELVLYEDEITSIAKTGQSKRKN